MKVKPMDIQLKQNEIEKAVRNYVAEKIGINLTGKNLGIQFSMTRGAQGLVANLSIEDASDTPIPGYTDRDADQQKSAEVVNLPTTGSGSVGTAINTAVTAATATGSEGADPVLTEKSVPTETVQADPVKTEEAINTGSTATGDNQPTAVSIFGDD